MNFFRRAELTPEADALLGRYDQEIHRMLGPSYPHPVRMRDWELCRVLRAAESLAPDARILETGAFNTYLGLFLSQSHPHVTVSDLLVARAWKSALRTLRLAPAKKTEVGYLTWRRIMRRHGLRVLDIDLERVRLPDASFDCVIALSVIEHVPHVERALAEMHRVLAPGGRLLITTDCSPEPKPMDGGVRYFDEAELKRLFSPYAVTSPVNRPDFARENWCYGRETPVVTAFIEITKPR